jgi:hypothetical protein
MVQWIRIHNRFSTLIGTTIEPSRNTLELILERIPTPQTTAKSYPPFPVPELSFQEWVHPRDKCDPPVTEEDFIAAEIKQDHKNLAEGEGTISELNLLKAVEVGKMVARATSVAFQEVTNILPSNPFGPPKKIIPLFDTTVAPAKMYAPALDTADFAFISGNTATKVQIARAYAEEELAGWIYWYDACGRQIQYWKGQIADLEESEKQLKESRENGVKMLKLLLDQKKQMEDTKARIDETKRHSSVVARHLERTVQSPRTTPIPAAISNEYTPS